MVQQLWDALKPIINSQAPAMKVLLARFNVSDEERSPFLRTFDSVEEILNLYRDEQPAKDEQDDIDE